MRLGIVSDIHGNIDALQTAISSMAGDVEEILVAGDAFSDHRFSNDVIAEIRATGARYILGNHEMSLLGPAGINARKSPRVSPELLEFVSEQPLFIRTRIGSKTLLMVHGSPWEPYGDYLMPGNAKFMRCSELETDYLIMGHTHTSFTARFDRTLAINPGSMGKSDDPSRGDVVTYMTLDTDSDETTLYEIPNPLLQPR